MDTNENKPESDSEFATRVIHYLETDSEVSEEDMNRLKAMFASYTATPSPVSTLVTNVGLEELSKPAEPVNTHVVYTQPEPDMDGFLVWDDLDEDIQEALKILRRLYVVSKALVFSNASFTDEENEQLDDAHKTLKKLPAYNKGLLPYYVFENLCDAKENRLIVENKSNIVMPEESYVDITELQNMTPKTSISSAMFADSLEEVAGLGIRANGELEVFAVGNDGKSTIVDEKGMKHVMENIGTAPASELLEEEIMSEDEITATMPKIPSCPEDVENSNLYKHALEELELAGYFTAAEKDELGEMLSTDVLELMRVFCKQGHSGMSAGLVINIFSRLAKYQTLTAFKNPSLDGKYQDVSEMSGKPKGTMLQSTRLSHVFSDDGGETWYTIDANFFRNKLRKWCYFELLQKLPEGRLLDFAYTLLTREPFNVRKEYLEFDLNGLRISE